MTEETPQYLVDAQAMTGTGYETPSIEIGQAQTIIQRTGNKLHAIDRRNQDSKYQTVRG